MGVALDLLMWAVVMVGGGWINLKLDVYRRTGQVPTWQRLVPW
jgi:hypothetical protein